MASGWIVCCSQKTTSALQRSCKDSEYDKRYSCSTFYFICLCFHHASKVSAADIRALWMGPQMQIFFYFWWVAWRSTWRSEVALPKDSQLHGFNCCLVPICTSLLKPSLSVEILTRCCWLHCRHPANSINPTAMNRRQLLWTQRGLTQFKMWLIGEDKLSWYKAQGISF